MEIVQFRDQNQLIILNQFLAFRDTFVLASFCYK